MTAHLPDDVDRRLRDLFEADAAAAERVVRAVSGATPARRGGRVVRRLAPLVVGVAALIAAAAFWTKREPPDPVTAGGPLSPAMTASFQDGVMVMPFPDSSIAILGPGVRDDRPPDGFGIVLVSGEEP